MSRKRAAHEVAEPGNVDKADAAHEPAHNAQHTEVAERSVFRRFDAKRWLGILRQQAARLCHVYSSNKRISLPLTAVLVIGILGIVPVTRYAIIGLAVKQTLTVTVVDSQANTPVSKASIMIGKQNISTNAAGVARITTNVGYHMLAITKQYYAPYYHDQLLSLSEEHNHITIKLVALGRLVPVTVTNRLTGRPVAGAVVKALNSEATTGADGTATIVLPTTAVTQQAMVNAKGYNALAQTLTVTNQKVAANSFAITPAGKIYFLSNLSGKIDVVKTDLDGTNRQTVLAGTGHENQYNTVLLASRDWKYLALYTQRKATGGPEIDLIDTSDDKLSNIDEGNANFTLVGWDDDRFIYYVSRNNVSLWQNGQEALKSFDATTQQLTVLAQTAATGSNSYDYFGQRLDGVYISGSKIIYALGWSAGYYNWYQLASKQATLNSVNADGSGRTVIKSFSLKPGTSASEVYLNIQPYDEPSALAVAFPNGSSTDFYEYSNGKLSPASDISDQNFYSNSYPTYLLSPSSDRVFWSVYSDGKNTLKVGDGQGQNARTIETESDYNTYGWFTDGYLLMSKNGSELYIAAADGSSQPFKIANYYKPNAIYRGYGGGYGGL